MAEPVTVPPPAAEPAAAFRELDAFLAHFPAELRTRTLLIPALQKAQELFGHLPPAVQRHVAAALGLTAGEVYGVATFYHYFHLQPQGRHVINVCLGTPCYVKGARGLLAALRRELGIDLGGTTPDRRFSLGCQRCVGACVLAPILIIDQKVHSYVTPKKLAAILAQYP
ncbi:MAG: NAD(P)H-dependent oxidoreductase subunit E [Lentisphaeria bacterium]|jgi:NADH:ubiquinone oxidoreductase subunit E